MGRSSLVEEMRANREDLQRNLRKMREANKMVSKETAALLGRVTKAKFEAVESGDKLESDMAKAELEAPIFILSSFLMSQVNIHDAAMQEGDPKYLLDQLRISVREVIGGLIKKYDELGLPLPVEMLMERKRFERR